MKKEINHQSSIKSAVLNELFRIGCFLLYYVFLIGVGAAVLLGAFWASLHLLADVWPEVDSLRAILILLMVESRKAFVLVQKGHKGNDGRGIRNREPRIVRYD